MITLTWNLKRIYEFLHFEMYAAQGDIFWKDEVNGTPIFKREK
jgi:hypothetical protein